MKKARIAWAVFAAIAAVPACQMLIGYEDKELADSPTDSGTDRPTTITESGGSILTDGGGAATGDCPVTTKGPRLVEVAAPGGGKMCIDETEVTQAQYRAFTTEVTALRDQPPECAWNTDIRPNDVCLNKVDDGDASPYLCLERTPACDNAPQGCVDWCDAYYYCTWAGKRLCGKIGGGPVGSTQGTNPAISQWLNACSSSGKRTFPYGGSFDGGACYTRSDAGYPLLPVKSFPGCTTPDGVLDMSGSVAEWEDSCATRNGAEDICVYRGGSFLTDQVPELFDCVRQQGRARSLAAKWRGFRCCYP